MSTLNKLKITPTIKVVPQLPAAPTPSSSLFSIFQKSRSVPKEPSLDRLHPTKEQPSVHYEDEGIWKVDINFFKKHTPSSFQHRRNSYGKTTFESLDALCEAELHRRFPNKTFSEKERMKIKKEIAHSACNRKDFTVKPSLVFPLQQDLSLSNEKLETHVHFLHNSPMNGQSYWKDGKKVVLTHALSCSNDRSSENIPMCRRVSDKEGNSICYTGRPDSLHKAEEQAEFIFLEELHSRNPRGIVKTNEIDSLTGQPIYEMNYVINCLLSTSIFLKLPFKCLVPYPERKYLENEIKALEQLKKGTYQIKDPTSGKFYAVRFRPILFSRQFNFFGGLEKILPPFLSGQSRARSITQHALKQMQQLCDQRTSTLNSLIKNSSDLETVKQAKQEKELLASLFHTLCHCKLLPEEEQLLKDLLCFLLNLPIVYHCKSSTDRTSFLALCVSLRQWISAGNPIPKDFVSLLSDWRFKELFVMNLMAGHQVTRYSRGAKGTVNGQALNNRNLGLAFERGVTQNPVFLRLFPERYLIPFSLSNEVKNKFIQWNVKNPILAKIAAIAGGFFAFLCSGISLYAVFALCRLNRPFALNEDSVQVGKRRLIAHNSAH